MKEIEVIKDMKLYPFVGYGAWVQPFERKYFEVDVAGHFEYAWEYLRVHHPEMTADCSADSYKILEDMGWVRVVHSSNVFLDGIASSIKQFFKTCVQPKDLDRIAPLWVAFMTDECHEVVLDYNQDTIKARQNLRELRT